MCLIFSPVVTSEKFSGGKSSASSSGCSCCGSSTDSGATMATPPSSNRVSGLSTSLVCVLLRLLFPSSRLSHQSTLQVESLDVSCLRSALDRSAHVDINASWPLRYPLVLLKGCHCTQDANSVQHTQSEHEQRVLALDSSK